MATGIRKRGASYEASVYLKREGRKLRRTFPTLAAAKAWRAEAVTAANKGALRAPQPTTVREAWEAWYEGARAGAVRNRSGDPYKPAAVRSYEAAMRLRVLPALGDVKLVDVGRPDLQRFAYQLGADGLAPATVRGRSSRCGRSSATPSASATWLRTRRPASSSRQCARVVTESRPRPRPRR